MKKITILFSLVALVLASSFTSQATFKEKLTDKKWKLVKTIIGEGEDAFEVPAEEIQVVQFNADFTYTDKSVDEGAENLNFSSKWELLEAENAFKMYLDETAEEFTNVEVKSLDDKTLHFKYVLDDVMEFVYVAY
ncbi:MAG: hypothetical protein AB8B61_05430 [Cyclobacteriaceae bacterium]